MNTYLDDLAFELRLLNVPGDRIGQILTETRSHLVESGEDPAEAFGPAKQYAKEFAQAPGRTSGSGSTGGPVGIALWLVAFAGAGVAVNAVLSLLTRTSTWFGLPWWAALLLGVALLAVSVVLTYRLKDPIVDPRTGRPVGHSRSGAISLNAGDSATTRPDDDAAGPSSTPRP